MPADLEATRAEMPAYGQNQCIGRKDAHGGEGEDKAQQPHQTAMPARYCERACAIGNACTCPSAGAPCITGIARIKGNGHVQRAAQTRFRVPPRNRYSGKLKGNLGDIGTCGKAPDDCYRRKSCMQHDSGCFAARTQWAKMSTSSKPARSRPPRTDTKRKQALSQRCPAFPLQHRRQLGPQRMEMQHVGCRIMFLLLG